jgi:hypothetical protein
VLHDFDKSGFSILGTLIRSTRRYSFKNNLRVIDLGLRLEDIEEYDLACEDSGITGDRLSIVHNLRKNGATDKEASYIANGHRVELNAFTSAKFVTWIESKLEKHGIQKVVPNQSTLEEAYRRALQAQHIEEMSQSIATEAQQIALEAELPPELSGRVLSAIKDDPSRPWDLIIRDMVNENG